jgi:hypothetical protein
MITGHVLAVPVPPDHATNRVTAAVRRKETWKIARILILRHQLAILQRRQPRRPKLNWADRALLGILLSVIPKTRRRGLRLLVTPDTVLRWHRDIVRRRHAARSMHAKTGRPPAGAPGPWCSSWPGRTPTGATAGSTVNWPSWQSRSRRPVGTDRSLSHKPLTESTGRGSRVPQAEPLAATGGSTSANAAVVVLASAQSPVWEASCGLPVTPGRVGDRLGRSSLVSRSWHCAC